MTLKTKVKLFITGLLIIAGITVVLFLLNSPWTKAGVGAFLLWFATIPVKRGAKSDQDSKNTDPSAGLSDAAKRTIAASPGEVEDIIDSGLREAFRNPVKPTGQGEVDPVGGLDRKDNGGSSS